MPRLAICIAATLALGANALPMLGLDSTTVKENIAKTQGKEAAEKFAAHWAKIKSMHGGHHAAATSHSSGGFWAKAQAFFTAYKRKSDPSKPNKMPGFAGIGGFMKQYDDMHTWYCAKADNSAKSVCTSSKKAAGAHPLFSSAHKDHAAWVEMANGYCAEHTDTAKSFLCGPMLKRMHTKGGGSLALPG